MGIISRIKKRLPIVGSGSAEQPIRSSAPARPAPYTEPRRPAGGGAPARGEQDPAEWIARIVAEHPIVLFMKGSPMAPQCGFSANAAAILGAYEKPLYHVDVLADPEVRQAVKEFSSWPTIPQIYIGGEFVGGSDILQQLQGSGELDELIGAAFAAGAAETEQAPEAG